MLRGPQKQCSGVSDVQIYKYKYTNTASVKVAGRPNMCYIFEKVAVQALSKWKYEPLEDVELIAQKQKLVFKI